MYLSDLKIISLDRFLGKSGPQLGRQAPWELGSDQRNTRRTSSNLDIETLRYLVDQTSSLYKLTYNLQKTEICSNTQQAKNFKILIG